jgi:hypothetical protein
VKTPCSLPSSSRKTKFLMSDINITPQISCYILIKFLSIYNFSADVADSYWYVKKRQ